MTNIPYQSLPSWPAYLESTMLRYHFVVEELDQVSATAMRLCYSTYGSLR